MAQSDRKQFQTHCLLQAAHMISQCTAVETVHTLFNIGNPKTLQELLRAPGSTTDPAPRVEKAGTSSGSPRAEDEDRRKSPRLTAKKKMEEESINNQCWKPKTQHDVNTVTRKARLSSRKGTGTNKAQHPYLRRPTGKPVHAPLTPDSGWSPPAATHMVGILRSLILHPSASQLLLQHPGS